MAKKRNDDSDPYEFGSCTSYVERTGDNGEGYCKVCNWLDSAHPLGQAQTQATAKVDNLIAQLADTAAEQIKQPADRIVALALEILDFVSGDCQEAEQLVAAVLFCCGAGELRDLYSDLLPVSRDGSKRETIRDLVYPRETAAPIEKGGLS